MSPLIGLIFVFHGVVRARNNRALVAKKPFNRGPQRAVLAWGERSARQKCYTRALPAVT